MTQNVDLALTQTAGIDPVLDVLLGILEDTTNEWRQNLGDVPVEAIVWQASPGLHSIGAILLHIAAVEVWWLHEIGAGIPVTPEQKALFLSAETRPDDHIWPQPPAQPLEWYTGVLNTVRARTREIVAGWDDAGAKRPLSHEGNEYAFTLRWLVGHVITHEAYHGGQAVLLSLEHGRRNAV